jgi:hypothetical protein
MFARLAVLFVATLALAATADAACLTCIGNGIGWDGTCQPSYNTRCSYTCCLWDEGTPCDVRENTYGCAEGSPLIVPSIYFASRLPMQTAGSALRVSLGKGKPVQRECAPSIRLKRS